MKTHTAIINFGPSGVGKDYCVNSQMIEYLGAAGFVSGDWCRDNAPSFADKGALVKDNLILEAAEARFHEVKMKHAYFFFDCPRSGEQVRKLCKFYKSVGVKHILALHMTAPREICRARIVYRAINQQRTDDQHPDSVEKRLVTYFNPGGTRDTVWPLLIESVDDNRVIDASADLESVRKYVRTVVIPWIAERVPVEV